MKEIPTENIVLVTGGHDVGDIFRGKNFVDVFKGDDEWFRFIAKDGEIQPGFIHR